MSIPTDTPQSRPFTIRRATRADVSALQELSITTFSQTFGYLYAPDDLQDFLESTYSPDALTTLLTDPNTPSGWRSMLAMVETLIPTRRRPLNRSRMCLPDHAHFPTLMCAPATGRLSGSMSGKACRIQAQAHSSCPSPSTGFLSVSRTPYGWASGHATTERSVSMSVSASRTRGNTDSKSAATAIMNSSLDGRCMPHFVNEA